MIRPTCGLFLKNQSTPAAEYGGSSLIKGIRLHFPTHSAEVAGVSPLHDFAENAFERKKHAMMASCLYQVSWTYTVHDVRNGIFFEEDN